MSRRRRRKPKVKWGRILFSSIIALSVIIVCAFAIGKVYDRTHKIKPAPSKNGSSSTAQGEKTINANYDFIDMDSEKIHTGNLILVNNKVAYTDGEPADLVTVYGNKSKNYSVKDTNVSLKKEVVAALNTMADDFYAATSTKGLMVISGYRTEAYQKKLYDADLAAKNITVSTLVAIPGRSEHHTGYAVDFGVISNKVVSDYDGTGKYAWINENSYKYGFIVRYKTDKSGLTGIANEPWHFRYVGQPHAYIITQNGFCYEEYIDYLKQFTFAKNHLQTTDATGAKYEIYYIPAEETTTKVPVPKDKTYTVSGNNVDGFIVTVTL